MPSALYYPHTKIQNPSLIRTSLLLWDKIDYIVPHRMTNQYMGDKDERIFQKALEIVGRQRIPSQDEKKEAHIAIERFIHIGLPKTFYLPQGFNDDDFREEYLIYPQKFFQKTWDLLQHHNFARLGRMHGDYIVTPAFGLLIMSILADVCAGQQLIKVTDREEQYTWLMEKLTNELGGQYLSGVQQNIISTDYDRLINITLKLLDTDSISIASLVAMREREEKGSSGDYRAFRERYAKAIKEYADNLVKNTKSANDVKEVERQFQTTMKDDLKELKTELNLNFRKIAFSKEVVMATVAIAGSLIPLLSPFKIPLDIAGVGVLIGKKADYEASKRKILKDHPMSWLYVAGKQPTRLARPGYAF